MKIIKNLAIIVLMTAFLIILSTKVEATTGTINSETVRLRKEPNTKSTILDQLDKGDEVEVLEQEEGWYKVIATIDGKKITGYISEKLLDVEGNVNSSNSNEQNPSEEPQENNEQTPQEDTTEENPNEEPGVTIEENKEYELKQSINTKILPLINSMNKETIENGNIKVVEMINDWCKIEDATQDGWVRVNILKKSIAGNITTSEPSTPDEQTKPAEPNEPDNTATEPETTPTNATVIKTAYVSTESLKVRKEPNTSSEVIDSLRKNNQVSIIEELDGWYKIKISGKIGYVSSKYISDKKVEETTSRGGNTERDTSTTQKENETQKPVQEETTNNTTDTTTSSKGTEVVEFAKKYLGYKYVSGGASPSTGFDCSGFTSYVYKQFGVSLYRTSRDQVKNGTAVSKSELKPGDLLIFNGESNKTIGHVGIYIGDGNFIHASNPKGGVKITALSSSYYASRYVGARRVI